MHAQEADAETHAVDASAASVTVTVEVPSTPAVPHELPRTGADIDLLVSLAVALIVLGIFALVIARTRLETSHA